MTTQWEKVFVFISSTFNDMHAERDYLVKQVFPELREWCDRRRLRLMDIDLRWGVTEQDALHNKNVVKVCLDRINDCRPFFLCFLGQRRGWVPGEADISAATLDEYPALKQYVGDASVTEMEILHALVNPLHRGKIRDPKRLSEYYEPSKYAFFYLRDDAYLNQIPPNPPELRQTYTNEGLDNREERARQDAQLKRWREEMIPEVGRPVRHYQARWDPRQTTPELLLPLQCPSDEPASVARWQTQWRKAGVPVTGKDLTQDPTLADKAATYNTKLSTGRLNDFTFQAQPLSRIILQDLQDAIAQRFPDHQETGGQSDLQEEIDHQEQFLYTGSEGFISRGDDFKDLDAYVDGDEKRLFVLTAPAGMGKSTLLANWVDRCRDRIRGKPGQSVHFRFIGQSERSTTVYSLLYFLMRELKEIYGKLTLTVPTDPEKLRQEFGKLLEAAGSKGKTIIVLDAVNQLDTGLTDLAWLPTQLPANVKLVVSFKRGEPAAENLLRNLQRQALLAEVKPFADRNDRRSLVTAYLSQYLKDLDARHLETLIQTPGAENPLFLKVVLSELRVFGAFSNLGEKIRSDFGNTPISAFDGVLKRLENDPACSPVDPKLAVPLLFGLLAYARQGLSAEELTGLFEQVLWPGDPTASHRQAASESVYLVLRQVRPFLVYRSGSFDFFYESFKLAAQQRYAGTGSSRRPAADWHRLLADYFTAQPLMTEMDGQQTFNRRKLSESAYHQASAGLSDALVNTFTDFDFMQASIALFGPYPVIDNFKLLDAPLVRITPEGKDALLLVRDALQLSAHVLMRDAAQLPAQVIGRLQSLDAPLIHSLVAQAQAWWGDQPWIRPTNVQFTRPGGALVTTIKGEIGGTQLYALPDGKQVLSVSSPGVVGYQTVSIWDTEKRVLVRKFDKVSEAVVTPDGRRAVLFSFEANQVEVKVLDLTTLQEVKTITARGGVITSRAITANGRYAVTVSHWGSAIKVWNMKEGQEQAGFFTSQVKEMIPLPEGRLALLPMIRYTVQNNGSGSLPASRSVPFESYSPPATGQMGTTVPKPKTIRIWDTRRNECLFELHHNGNNDILGFVVTMDGKTGISSCYSDVTVWNMNDGTIVHKLPCVGMIDAISPTPDGKRLITSARGSFQVWDLAIGKEIVKFTSAVQTISMAAAPDGKTIASASMEGVELWDIEKGALIRSFKSLETIQKVHFLPDGHAIVLETMQKTGSRLKTLKVLDVKTGQELHNIKAVVPGAPVVLTPDSRKAAVAIPVSKDGKEVLNTADPYSKFIVWDLEKGEDLPGLTGKQTEGSAVIAISGDGQQIASGLINSREIKIWDAQNGSESKSLRLENLSGVNKILMDPDGIHAITESNNYLLTVWDLEQGEVAHSVFTHEIDSRMYANLLTTPDNKQAITISKDGVIKIWDLENGEERHTVPIEPFPMDQLKRFLITPDGRRLFSIFSSNTVNVWDIQQGTLAFSATGVPWIGNAFAVDLQTMKTITPNVDKLVVVDLAKRTPEPVPTIGRVTVFHENNHPVTQKEPTPTPDGQALLSISTRQIIVWDLKTGTKQNTLTANNDVQAIALTADGQKLFSSSTDTLQVWDMNRLGVKGSTPEDIRHASIVKIIVSPDGTKAVSASDYQHVKVWDAATGENLFTFPLPGNLDVFRVSAEGQRIIYSSAIALKIFDLASGRELLSVPKQGSNDVVSPDGDTGLWMQMNELIYGELKQGGTRRVLRKFEPGYKMGLGKINDDGKRAVITHSNYSNRNNIRHSLSIWDLEQGKELRIHEDEWIQSIDISPNGKRAVTASFNRIAVWNLENGKEMHSIDFHSDTSSYRKVGLITPDGKRILSSTSDNTAGKVVKKVWDLESGKELMSLEPSQNIAYLSNGKQLLFSSFDPQARRTTMKIQGLERFEVQLELEGLYQPGQTVAVTADCQMAVSVGLFRGTNQEGPTDRLVEVWELQAGKKIATLYMDSDISAYTVSPDGRTIVLGDVMGQVHFLRLENLPAGEDRNSLK
ncbi:MAG TPA: DUF4062 domain-containing protein [Anaerolineaceae bacterium]|nr:DUF4062 domain-containing protein [Anaerolineaceae bacterium]